MTVRTFFPRIRQPAAVSLLLAVAVCTGVSDRGMAQQPGGSVPSAGNSPAWQSLDTRGPAHPSGAGPKIIVRPPTFRSDDVGHLVAEPNVQYRSPKPEVPYQQYVPPSGSRSAAREDIRNVNLNVAPPDGAVVPPQYPAVAPGYRQQPVENVMPGTPQPIFGDVVFDEFRGEIVPEAECNGRGCNTREVWDPLKQLFSGGNVTEFGGWDLNECDECSPFKQLFAFKLYKTSCDPGIGRERVRFALMEIERSEPLNNFSIQYADYNKLHYPDRSEYFWAKQGRSPAAPEKTVDYQDIILRLEQGGKRASFFTAIPFRLLNPVVNDNTAGPADISFGPKVVIVDGRRWQLSHLFTTTVQAGAVPRGLSAGHTSLEPAFMLRYKWTDSTYIHGDLKWRFPVGGDPVFKGDVLKWGIGVSTILYETDTFAALPTLEFVGWNMMSGAKTGPDGIVTDVDQESFYSIYPGMRFVLGPSGDLGLFELGIGGGFTLNGIGNDAIFETMFRLDMRFSW